MFLQHCSFFFTMVKWTRTRHISTMSRLACERKKKKKNTSKKKKKMAEKDN